VDPGILSETLRRHYAYLMNPGNELAHIRGGLFTFFFFLAPRAALVNLTQVPMFAYPYLAKRLGDKTALAGLARGFKLIKTAMTKGPDSVLSKEFQAFFQRGYEDGFLNESLATETAGLAEAPTIRKAAWANQAEYTIRQVHRLGVGMFKASEEYNRRVTFYAALEGGKARGLKGDQLYEFARDVIDKTMFEYARWNRPQFTRGKRSVFFIFRLFQQNALFYAASNQGGWRFWMMLLALGGLRGLPLAAEFLAVSSLLGTLLKRLFGGKSPYVEAEREAREFLAHFVSNPDLVINGLARESLGLAPLSHMFGLPFPSLDLSKSLQYGEVLPFIDPLARAMQGSMSGKDAILRALVNTAGAGGTSSYNLASALLDPGVSATRIAAYMPSFIKNTVKTYQYMSGNSVDSRGRKLMEFDVNNPEHVGEIVGQLMGLTPTRIARDREANAMAREMVAYYLTRRQLVMDKLQQAVGDQQDMAEARRALIRFNTEAPTPFRIDGRSARSALQSREKTQYLRERGLPPNRRLWEEYRKIQELYQIPPDARK